MSSFSNRSTKLICWAMKLGEAIIIDNWAKTAPCFDIAIICHSLSRDIKEMLYVWQSRQDTYLSLWSYERDLSITVCAKPALRTHSTWQTSLLSDINTDLASFTPLLNVDSLIKQMDAINLYLVAIFF